MELKKYKLSEVATFEISNVDKKTKAGELSVHLCNFTDVYYNWAVTETMEDSFMVATASDNQIKKLSLRKGQVAITKDSETRHDIGIPTYIANDFDNTVLGYHCALITPNPEMLDGRYLNAYLNSSLAKEYFANNASGSGMRYSLPVDAIKNILLYLPSIEVQREIGKIFSDIDRKIALNREINRNLEAMARQLYDYWFLQLDFPDENGRPYKSSGGKMVWNEKLKREIPEEWNIVTLSQLVQVKDGTHESPKPCSDGKFLITSKHLGKDKIDFSNAYKISIEDFTHINKRSLVEYGDILFSMIGTIGNKYLVIETEIDFAIKNMALIKSSATPYLQYFILQSLDSNDYRRFETNALSGSMQKFLSLDKMRSIPILYNDEIIRRYSNETINILKSINIIKDEIATLIRQRDELLPLLINGQVSVMPPEVNCDLSLD